MELRLDNKQVFITGGSRGIGLAVARAFAAEGAEVAICGRDREVAEAAAAAVAAEFSVRVIGIGADVTDPVDIDDAVKTIRETFGGLDILINNAGTGTRERILDAPDEKWYDVWDLHVMSVIRTVRACVPLIRERGGGVVINTSSICGRQPIWYEPIYNVTKAALDMLTKCLSTELIGEHIRVNSISPGLIRTAPWEAAAAEFSARDGGSVDEFLDGIASEHAPIRRFATPEELAHTYLFLASEVSSYTVGENVLVDGGWLKTVK